MAANTPRDGDLSPRAQNRTRKSKLAAATPGPGGSWLRLFVEILDNPKIHELDTDLFTGWIKVLLATKKHRQNGKLPGGQILAFWVHQEGSTVSRWLRDLEARGFLDRDDDGQLWVRNWLNWQSPTSAERQQRYRARKKDDLSRTLSGGIDRDIDREGDTNRNARCNADVTRDVTRYVTRVTRDVTRDSAPPKITPPIFDSRQQEVLDLATQRWGSSNGDCIVGDLLRIYPPELVMEAMDRHFDKVGPAIRPALLRAACQGMLSDGWPRCSGKIEHGSSPVAKTYGLHQGP